MLFSSFSWPDHFVWLMKNSDFLLLARYPAPIYSRCQRISLLVLVYFPGLLQLCHLAKPVYCIRVFGQFFLKYCWLVGKNVKPFLVNVSEEKARLLQWLVFVRQFNAIGPLFCSFVQLLGREVNPDFLGSEKQESVSLSLALNHNFYASKSREYTKGSPLAVFFRHYATIFQKFSKSIKGNSSEFFETFVL